VEVDCGDYWFETFFEDADGIFSGSQVGGSEFAGFVGGVLGTRLTRTGEDSRAERVVRARSFELVDEAGKVISFWGGDKREQTVLY